MRKLVPFRTAAHTLIVLFVLAAIFQLTVLAGLVPTEMVWGGRLKNADVRTVGALVSLTMLLLMIAVVLMRMGVIGKRVPAIGKYGAWAIAGIFALNTVGNLFALDLRETLIFTPLTAILAVLAWRVALGRE